MASVSEPLRVAAQRMLRESTQYAAARRVGPTTARMWLDRETGRLAERLLDEVWRWVPAEPEVPDLMAALEESLSAALPSREQGHTKTPENSDQPKET